MNIKYILNLFASALLLTFSSTAAYALCDDETEAVEAISVALAQNAGARLQACGNMRICMGQGRIERAECKQTVREEKFACLTECREEFTGREKRQCKQACRADKRIAKMTCRNLSRGDRAECRSDNPDCVDLRNQAVKLTIESVSVSAALYQCLRLNGGEAETEEDKEAVEDAEEASQAEG